MENNEVKYISILGCGWLGLPLAEDLLREGYSIKGATTNPQKLDQLSEKGIKPYLINLDPDFNSDFDRNFFDADLLLINIPPKRRDDIIDYHTTQMAHIIKQIKAGTIEKVIFISSTSVYPSVNREVREEDAGPPLKNNGQALMQVEKMLEEEQSFQTTILRFCGLIGNDRHPGRFLAGKKLQSSGQNPVNLIHQEDCIRIIRMVIANNIYGEIFNACSDKHPTRETFYGIAAENTGHPPPQFENNAPPAYKIINSNKLKDHLGFRFNYPDPTMIFNQ